MWAIAAHVSRGKAAPRKKLFLKRKDFGYGGKKGLPKFVFLVKVNTENNKQSLSAGVVDHYWGHSGAFAIRR